MPTTAPHAVGRDAGEPAGDPQCLVGHRQGVPAVTVSDDLSGPECPVDLDARGHPEQLVTSADATEPGQLLCDVHDWSG
jgi:hypothetical protein